jgi:hypothetical protein
VPSHCADQIDAGRNFLGPLVAATKGHERVKGLDPLFKSLDLACLQPKPRNLDIRKASLKFDALVGDRQVIANESFGVSRFILKGRVRRLTLRHRSVQLLLRIVRSLHGN